MKHRHQRLAGAKYSGLACIDSRWDNTRSDADQFLVLAADVRTLRDPQGYRVTLYWWVTRTIRNQNWFMTVPV